MNEGVISEKILIDTRKEEEEDEKEEGKKGRNM